MVLDQVIAVHKISPLSQFDEKQLNFSFTYIVLDSRLIKSPYHSLPLMKYQKWILSHSKKINRDYFLTL